MIRTLVQPAPVIAVHMSRAGEEAPPNTDLHFAGPQDFDGAARQILEELKRRGVLLQTSGRQVHQSVFNLVRRARLFDSIETPVVAFFINNFEGFS